MAYEVLFVCTGNVCRSPAAERLVRRGIDVAVGGIAGLSGVTVSSAGTWALVGEPISPPMAALIAGDGADAKGFAARQLTADIVRGRGPRHHHDERPSPARPWRWCPWRSSGRSCLGELAHMLATAWTG